jgi:hypothetical protein
MIRPNPGCGKVHLRCGAFVFPKIPILAKDSESVGIFLVGTLRARSAELALGLLELLSRGHWS